MSDKADALVEGAGNIVGNWTDAFADTSMRFVSGLLSFDFETTIKYAPCYKSMVVLISLAEPLPLLVSPQSGLRNLHAYFRPTPQ